MSHALPSPPALSRAWRRTALVCALFLFIWGAKLAVLDRFGSDLPFWDQWSKEGDEFYPAWFEQGEFWRPLLAPHNEHRIAPTLALNLGLILLGGQWDGRVQCVVSAALHAALLAGLFAWALRRLEPRRAIAVGVLLGLIGAAPLAWENLLSGFQSQFYFLTGFSLLAIAGLMSAPAFSARWGAGAGCAALSLVSMGSGLLCAAPVLVIAIGRLREPEPRRRRDAWATLGVALALLAAGAWLHTSVPGHAVLRAHTAGEFLLYFARCLAWPLPQHPWLAVVFWAPWFVLAARWAGGVVSRKRADSSRANTDEFVVAAGAWVLLQAAAVAYARGGGGELPASRYGDVFGAGLALCGLALGLVMADSIRARLLGAAWVIALLAAGGIATRATWQTALPNKKADHLAYEQSVRDFVQTDDFATLEKQVIPFPNAEWLARVLRRPHIREILPVSVRAPLPLPGFADQVETPAPSLAPRSTRALLQPGEWRSATLPPASFGWWKFETAGHLGAPGATLQLVAARDGRVLGAIAPSKFAGNSWRAAYVRAPREPALLIARTDAAGRWLAWSEPAGMSALSYWTWRGCKYGAHLACVALAGFAFAAGAALWTRSSPSPLRHPAGGR